LKFTLAKKYVLTQHIEGGKIHMFNLNNENSKKLITITGNQATGMSRKGLSRLYIDLFPHAVHYGTTMKM